MWRSLFLAVLLGLGAATAHAASGPMTGAWSACERAPGAGAPRLVHCRPLVGGIDPQGRELWLRAPIRAKTAREKPPSAVYVFGAASTEAWFTGVSLGANGAPGPTADAERPGLYEAVFPIPESLWRADR